MLTGNRPARAPLFVAVFLLLLALVPATSAGDPNGPRVITTLALLAAGALLFWLSWPKRTWVRFDFVQQTLRTAGREWAFSALDRFALCGELARYDDLVEARYQVDLLLKDGSRLPVLAHKDAAKVWGDLTKLAAAVGLPISTGWGLTTVPSIPAVEAVRKLSLPPRDISVRISPLHHHRVIGKVVVALGAIALFNLALLVGIEIELGFESLPLSLFLPASTAGFILLVGFAVLTRHDELKIGGDLSIAKRVIGVAVKTRRVGLEQLHAVHLISPDGQEPRHLLILAGNQVLTFPYVQKISEPAFELLRRLAGASVSRDHQARALGSK